MTSTRRTFITQSLAAATVLAQEMPDQPLMLGLDSYTLRSWNWKADELIDYCAAQKIESLQLTLPGDLASTDKAYLKSIQEKALVARVRLEGAIGSISKLSPAWNESNGSPQRMLEMGIDWCRQLSAPVLRCYLANPGYRIKDRPVKVDGLIEDAAKQLRLVRTRAQDKEVKLAVENHGDITAREMLQLINSAGEDIAGVCLDSGNPMWVMEDPLFTLELLGKYVVTSHLRDTCLYPHPRGAAFQWVALGDGNIDFKTYAKRFRELCPQAPFQLEIITGRPPQVIPYLETDLWKTFPKARAADFARFVRLAESGHPFQGTMVIADDPKLPAEYQAALKTQQRFDLERSLVHARSLGVGRRNEAGA